MISAVLSHVSRLLLHTERIASNIICLLVPTKRLRHIVRLHLTSPLNIKADPTPKQRSEKRIDIAFCFDINIIKQARVSIFSLLKNSNCSYNIYCVNDDSVPAKVQSEIEDIVKECDKNSSIKFLKPNNDFDNSYRGEWSIGTYYRCMLPVLLELDSVIYADVDTLFLRDLSETKSIDLGDNLLAGVLEKRDYINAGFLIMNLKKIREENIYQQLVKTSQNAQFKFPDQDLFNFICKDRILFLPWKYNVMATDTLWQRMFHGSNVGISKCTMIHYAGNSKPWNTNLRFIPLFSLWRRYSAMCNNSQ